jgi:hypothetical protein
VTCASVGVLASSNGSPVDNWLVRGTEIQPQVWLSVLTVFMDGLLVIALAEGATISFWTQAVRGTTVSIPYPMGILEGTADFHSFKICTSAMNQLE